MNSPDPAKLVCVVSQDGQEIACIPGTVPDLEEQLANLMKQHGKLKFKWVERLNCHDRQNLRP